MTLTRFAWLAALWCAGCPHPMFADAGPDASDGTVDDTAPSSCGATIHECDPVNVTSECASGLNCAFFYAPGEGFRATCVEPGSGSVGAACATLTDCQLGLSCTGSVGGCRKLCCNGDDTMCQSGPGGQAGARCTGVIMDSPSGGVSAPFMVCM